LPVPDKFEDLLMNTPEAKVVINEPEPYPEWDPLLRAIDEFYRKNYPNYIPTSMENCLNRRKLLWQWKI